MRISEIKYGDYSSRFILFESMLDSTQKDRAGSIQMWFLPRLLMWSGGFGAIGMVVVILMFPWSAVAYVIPFEASLTFIFFLIVLAASIDLAIWGNFAIAALLPFRAKIYAAEDLSSSVVVQRPIKSRERTLSALSGNDGIALGSKVSLCLLEQGLTLTAKGATSKLARSYHAIALRHVRHHPTLKALITFDGKKVSVTRINN